MAMVGEIEVVVARKVEHFLAVNDDLAPRGGIGEGRPFQSVGAGFVEYGLDPVFTHERHFVQLAELAQSRKWIIASSMNLIAALVPYVAVLLGMYLFHSAWLAILLYHIGIVTCLFFRRPVNLWSTVCGGLKTPLLVPSIVVCAMVAPVVYFMWPWLVASDGNLPEWMAYYGLTGWTWLLLIPYFSIAHPVLEEIHWRGIALKEGVGLSRYDFLFAGYHILVLFQLIHWPWLFLVFGVLMGSSFFWRWSAARFGGYAFPILTHAAADGAVILAAYFLLV